MIPWISLVFVVISPFSFLILIIWVFSLILVRFARGLSILFIFSKNQLFVLILCMFLFVSLVSSSLISALIFIISLPLLVLGFAYSCCSKRCFWDVALGFLRSFYPFNICTPDYKLST
jgi:hypothetical protein